MPSRGNTSGGRSSSLWRLQLREPEAALARTTGSGVAFNTAKGTAANLITKESFGDVEVHLEYLVAKGSNSGIKLQGVYEIQIFDSYGAKKLSGDHAGGIYPRAELLPKYHHIDEGYAPLVNASRAPGEWQVLDITFRAPRIDPDGKKTASARFVKVVLNGQVVQDDVEVPCPTGNNWRKADVPTGPIMLQGDHGPVAFRNMRVRPLRRTKKGGMRPLNDEVVNPLSLTWSTFHRLSLPGRGRRLRRGGGLFGRDGRRGLLRAGLRTGDIDDAVDHIRRSLGTDDIDGDSSSLFPAGSL